ncbi:MAG TPA: hypothetical protein VGS22_24220 [Thermoanaerobaculia bacterium]|nr:hypothetical protein [Thermoanaerobaculia bacterium]
MEAEPLRESPDPGSESVAPGKDTELGRKLREAAPDELVRLLAERRDEIGPGEAVEALRNPYLSDEGARAIAEQSNLVSAYEVRRALALSPRAPEVVALNLVVGLYWVDLLAVTLEVRVRPTVRRAAELALLTRLPRLAVGEKIALARRGGTGVIVALRSDPTPRVIAALLENPRLIEGLLAPALASDRAFPALLQAVAANPRWGARHDLRLLICRNPRTPIAVALSLLPALRKDELRGLAGDSRLAAPLRRRAELLCGAKERT